MEQETNYVKPRVEKSTITADQVVWVGNALDRYAKQIRGCFGDPGISRAQDVARLAAILEIMENLNIGFRDKHAAMSAISNLQELDIIDPRAVCTEPPKEK